MTLFRACDCTWIPCAHNPGKEHLAAKKRANDFEIRKAKLGFWGKLFHYFSLQAEQRAIIAELKATDWRLHRKNYG